MLVERIAKPRGIASSWPGVFCPPLAPFFLPRPKLVTLSPGAGVVFLVTLSKCQRNSLSAFSDKEIHQRKLFAELIKHLRGWYSSLVLLREWRRTGWLGVLRVNYRVSIFFGPKSHENGLESTSISRLFGTGLLGVKCLFPLLSDPFFAPSPKNHNHIVNSLCKWSFSFPPKKALRISLCALC